jgi:hypothetical protein
MDGLTIDIERCADGVEFVDDTYRWRTNHREASQITLSDLEDPVVVAFVNATDDVKRRLFFGKFGLLGLTPWWHQRDQRQFIHNAHHVPDDRFSAPRHDILDDQSRLRELLQKAGGENPVEAMEAINSALAATPGFQLTATFHLSGPQGTPRLLLKSRSLVGFMLMETAMVVAHGVRTTECEQCGNIFLTGPLTGRRSHAHYCSNKCRVAAMRARNAAPP